MLLTEIFTEPDVLIIGGGAAGVAAAVGASEGGASVVVLEKYGFLGGKATAAYVGTLCGLYYRSEAEIARPVMTGFPAGFAGQLGMRSHTQPVRQKNGLHFLPYDRFAFMALCDDWATRHVRTLCLHTQVCTAARDAHRVQTVEALVHHRPVVFRPQTVVDASGEATLAGLLHTGILRSDEYQASAQVFVLAGLPEADEQTLRLGLLRSIQRGLAKGDFDKAYERLSIVPGSAGQGRATLKLGIPLSVGNNPLDATGIELFARKAVHDILAYLRAHTDIFKNAWLAMMAPETGFRTGPRHRGKVVLDETDVLHCRKSDQTVARGAWPIENWQPGKDPEMRYFNPDDYYDIPAGTLQSAEIENLFFAGRNLSATDAAVASARVIGTCLATGYAAGRLAAGQVKNENSAFTLAAIRKALF